MVLLKWSEIVWWNKKEDNFSGVRVTRYLVLYVCFVDRCLFFVLFLLAIVLSVLISSHESFKCAKSYFDINSVVFHFDDFNYGRRSRPYCCLTIATQLFFFLSKYDFAHLKLSCQDILNLYTFEICVIRYFKCFKDFAIKYIELPVTMK
jgi:hypothetical protein